MNTHIDGQTDRLMEIERNRWTDNWREGQMDEWADMLKDVQRAGQVDKERTYDEMNEWTGRQGCRDVD